MEAVIAPTGINAGKRYRVRPTCLLAAFLAIHLALLPGNEWQLPAGSLCLQSRGGMYQRSIVRREDTHRVRYRFLVRWSADLDLQDECAHQYRCPKLIQQRV